jgi:hypothetical protein
MRKSIVVVSLMTVLVGSLRAQEVASTWQGTFQTETGSHRAVIQILRTEKDVPQSGAMFC